MSKLLRRIHMYVALFLGPWVLMYAASTFVMNHREMFRGRKQPPPQFVKERELTYDGSFPDGASPKEIGRQMLASLDMEGAFQANRRQRDGAIVVTRMDLRRPVRLTYLPESKQVTIERQPWETQAFLERFHRRRGYQQPFVTDLVWGFSVDLFIVAVLFWAGSGLWLWWEMKVTRPAGALLLLSGCALFVFFLAVL